MNLTKLSNNKVKELLKKAKKFPLAFKNYPSKGQTSIQEIYQTPYGKLFLKQTTKRNHQDCQVLIESGTLAEREFWAFRLAKRIGLKVPHLWLLDSFSTLQTWLDYSDARQYRASQKPPQLQAENIFNCALFDWCTGQVDRHDANYLYDYVNQEIILIDSAHCFLKYNGDLPDYLRDFERGFSQYLQKTYSSKIFHELITLSKTELFKLVPLRDLSERNALYQRWLQLHQIRNIQDILNLYRGVK